MTLLQLSGKLKKKNICSSDKTSAEETMFVKQELAEMANQTKRDGKTYIELLPEFKK